MPPLPEPEESEEARQARLTLEQLEHQIKALKELNLPPESLEAAPGSIARVSNLDMASIGLASIEENTELKNIETNLSSFGFLRISFNLCSGILISPLFISTARLIAPLIRLDKNDFNVFS